MRQPFRKASVYIALLLILEAVTGFLIIIVTAIYQTILSNYLEDIDRRLLFSYLFNVYILGAQLVVTFLCSLSLWNRLWKRRCTPNVRLMVSVWLFYSCVIIASGFGTVWNLYYNIDVLENSAESSLLRGIDEYYTSPEWKLLWDGLQLRKQCCGVYNYKDWMNAEWMPKQAQAGNTTYRTKAVLAPIACTKKISDNTNCAPNFAMNPEEYNSHKRAPFPSLTVDSINTNGCLPVFSESLWRYFYILLLLALMALKFLIFLCCFTKYILQRQNVGDGCDVGLTDEEGRPLVMVKYPRNVRCITIGEDDLASDMAPEATYCNCEEGVETCDYCEALLESLNENNVYSVTCLHSIQKFCERAINMPLMPNVPHIVGDDDDLSEADDQAQIATPCTVGEPSSQERKTADSPSSELSESSYDNDSEADEEDTNNSTAEEEDWSNNISYIVRTPEREPEQLVVDGSPKVDDVELPEDIAQTENVEAVDHTEDMDTEDADTQPATRTERLAPSERSSPMEENSRTNDAISVNSTPEMESELATRDYELEDTCADKPHTSRPARLKDSPTGKPAAVEYFSPPSRRQSLRSANRTSQSQSKAVPQPAAKTARSRQRKSKPSTDYSPVKRIGARVAKRSRQSLTLTLNKSPVKKPDVPLARPVEVTEYFTSISATLVSHRVNLLPFLYMRKRIDRLVGEAIAKTRIQRENNPVNAV